MTPLLLLMKLFFAKFRANPFQASHVKLLSTGNLNLNLKRLEHSSKEVSHGSTHRVSGMAKSLSSVVKKVNKRKGKSSPALHEKSRDAKKIRAASARDDKIARRVTMRAKLNQPYRRFSLPFECALCLRMASSATSGIFPRYCQSIYFNI